MAKKIDKTITAYKVTDGHSFVANGIVYGPGERIPESVFLSKEQIEKFVKNGKIIANLGIVISNTDKVKTNEQDGDVAGQTGDAPGTDDTAGTGDMDSAGDAAAGSTDA